MRDLEQKIFQDVQSGRLNSDDSLFAVGQNEWVNAENVRTGSTDKGVTGVVESIGGTLLLSPVQPSATFVTIGTVEDTENSRLIYFRKNTTGPWDRIDCYYANTGLIYTVLLSADVVGGLNFNKDFPIHSAKIINGLLVWPEGENNQPRQINIDSGIKSYDPSFVTDATPYSFPLNFSEITLIKHPPPLAPNIEKINFTSFASNFVENESFQFCFQYVWYDNQTTVTGTYSIATKLNSPSDNAGLGYNAILVVMDAFERIPSRVRIVNLIVRYGNTNISKKVKTWDREIPIEAAQIDAQNNSTVFLNYTFFNNINGETLAQDDTLRPFDNVPIYSETLETAKNRVFLGNNLEGYDTPDSTSLSLATTTTPIGASFYTKNLISIKQRRFERNPADTWAYVGWYVYMDELTPQGFYAITSTEVTVLGFPFYPPLPAAPATVAVSGLTFRGANLSQVLTNTIPPGYQPATRYDYFGSSTTVNITGASVPNYPVFKSSAFYKAGIVFYDFAMRKCGVVTNDNLIVSIPTRDFAYSTGVNAISWALSNADAENEIPDWAYYYTPVLTLNQLTRFFVDSFTDAAKYVQKNAQGEYTFTSDTLVTGTIGIGLNTTALYQSGLGYVFNEGDVCILTRDDNRQFRLPVVGQEGNYIIVKASDMGTLLNRRFVYEIYTPYQSSTQEPFFEMGEMYTIDDPGTIFRQYSTLGDIFPSDSFVFTRNYNNSTYFAEAMCPNDKYYKRWDTDAGKANFVTKLGQVRKGRYISFSDTFIPNTEVNGISTFRLGNQVNVPEDCGNITKLQLTSKIQSEGTVMLSICEVETNSMYLSEVQITDSTGKTQFFSQSDSVIGTINTLKGNFGCIDPTSVVQYRGNVYFLDRNNGRFIQYSLNGLDAISNYKMVRFWRYWCEKFSSMTKAEVEAFGDRPFVFSAIDTAHDELLISLPKLSNEPPKGFLPDYPSTIYPFDILDFQGKTITYKLGVGNTLPHWQGAFTFTTDYFCSLANNLYSFKQGNLWVHNQSGNQNNFYGVQYVSKLMFSFNKLPQVPKIYDNILSESNLVPKFVYFYNQYPEQQSSDLVDFSFTNLEGLWYANVLRNKLIPTAEGFDTDGLMTGEVMRNTNMLVLVQYEPFSLPLQLRMIQVDFSISKGFNFK